MIPDSGLESTLEKEVEETSSNDPKGELEQRAVLQKSDTGMGKSSEEDDEIESVYSAEISGSFGGSAARIYDLSIGRNCRDEPRKTEESEYEFQQRVAKARDSYEPGGPAYSTVCRFIADDDKEIPQERKDYAVRELIPHIFNIEIENMFKLETEDDQLARAVSLCDLYTLVRKKSDVNIESSMKKLKQHVAQNINLWIIAWVQNLTPCWERGVKNQANGREKDDFSLPSRYHFGMLRKHGLMTEAQYEYAMGQVDSILDNLYAQNNSERPPIKQPSLD